MTDLVLPAAPTSAALVQRPGERAPAAPVTSPATTGMAGELVGHVLAELPALGVLDGRDRLLAAAWLASLRSARTRRSYATDLLGWQTWLAERGIEVLGAGRVHVDVWVRAQQHAGAGDASVRRRLSGIGSFYRYCLSHDLTTTDPHHRGDPAAGGPRLHRHPSGSPASKAAP